MRYRRGRLVMTYDGRGRAQLEARDAPRRPGWVPSGPRPDAPVVSGDWLRAIRLGRMR
jgi:hypothetical protein